MLRLKLLVKELEASAAVGPAAQDRLKGDALYARDKGITPRVELLGRDLPVLYEELFGRCFTASAYEVSTEIRYSEGVRFVAAAAARMQVTATRQAVIDACKRFRGRSKKG